MNDDEVYPHKRLWRLTDQLRPLLQAYGRVWERQAGRVPDCGGSPMEAMDEAVGEVEAPIIAAVDALVKSAVEAERERCAGICDLRASQRRASMGSSTVEDASYYLEGAKALEKAAAAIREVKP